MIVVITARREGADYLAATLRSIDESATGRRVVVADSITWKPVAPLPASWESHAFERPKTERNENRWAMWEAMRLASEAREDLVFFEDDIEPCHAGAAYLERFIVPDDLAWVSFFDPWLDANVPEGLWRRRAHSFCYCQALKVPLRTCERFTALGTDGMAVVRRMGADDQLAEHGRRLGLSWGLHTPSIVQHVGAASLVGNGTLDARVSKTWRKDRDASDLHPYQYEQPWP